MFTRVYDRALNLVYFIQKVVRLARRVSIHLTALPVLPTRFASTGPVCATLGTGTLLTRRSVLLVSNSFLHSILPNECD